MNCANCDSDALFEYQVTHSRSVFYCGQHLPKFLEARKKAGLLKLTEKFEEVKKEAQDVIAFKPVQTELDEVTEEKPKPKKKATKKKAE